MFNCIANCERMMMTVFAVVDYCLRIVVLLYASEVRPKFFVLSCRVVERVDWLLYFSHDDQAFFLLPLTTHSTTIGKGNWCAFTTEVADILPSHPVNAQTVLFLGHRLETFGPDTLSALSADSINDRITSGSVVNVR